jgi:AcrR family transcriptional regulator
MNDPEVVRRPPFGDSPVVGKRGASTQRRILDAALDVFGEHGFHGTRVELITEAAGCSRPAFYQYFSDKNDVFWRLAGHLARALDDLAEQLVEPTPDAAGVERLGAWLDELVDLQRAYAPVFDAFQAATREQPPTPRVSLTISERFADVINLNTRGAKKRRAGEALAGATVATVLRTIHYWHRGLGQLDRERFVDGLARTVHRVLHGPIDDVNRGPALPLAAGDPPAWPTFPGLDGDPPELRPQGQQTRQKLLHAGAVILPRRGYHEARVDDIVEAAGVSHGSFYRYFTNKDQLFHVLAEEAARYMVGLVRTFPEHPDVPELRSWLAGWFESYRDNGGVISAWQEIDYDDPVLQAFSLDVAVVAFDRLCRIVERRGFGDPTVDGLVLLSVIERLPYNVYVLGYLEPDTAIDASVALVRRGLLGLDA